MATPEVRARTALMSYSDRIGLAVQALIAMGDRAKATPDDTLAQEIDTQTGVGFEASMTVVLLSRQQ